MAPASPAIRVEPVAGTIGAELHGVDLSRPIDSAVFERIHAALLEHLVIMLPGQKPLAPRHLRAFAQRFGVLDTDPFVFPFKIPPVDGYPEIYSNIKEADDTGLNIGGYWHADVTYRAKPHKASVLYAREVPACGGDTLFANQYLAYETLPEALQRRLETMQAVHSSAMPHGQSAARFASVDREHAPTEDDRSFAASGQYVDEVEVVENVHPVVRRHPVTGRKLLYVNRGFTSHFVDMTPAESLPLLEDLWAHASRLELTCRFRWAPHAVLVWDNCATQHYALNDYYGQRRHMMRISIHED